MQDVCVGERTCSDGKCSSDGVCSSELNRQTSMSSVSSDTSGPPSLTLAVTDVVGLRVDVKRGTPYRLCAGGQVPTADTPCEPLGTAVDSEGANLTSMVGARDGLI